MELDCLSTTCAAICGEDDPTSAIPQTATPVWRLHSEIDPGIWMAKFDNEEAKVPDNVIEKMKYGGTLIEVGAVLPKVSFGATSRILSLEKIPPPFKPESWQVGKEQLYLPATRAGSCHADLMLACATCGKIIVPKDQFYKINAGAVWTKDGLSNTVIYGAQFYNQWKKVHASQAHCIYCFSMVGAIYDQPYAKASSDEKTFPCCKIEIAHRQAHSIENRTVVTKSGGNSSKESVRSTIENLTENMDKPYRGPLINDETFETCLLRKEIADLKENMEHMDVSRGRKILKM